MLAVTRSGDAMTAPGDDEHDEHDEHCCSGIYPSRPDTSVTRACALLSVELATNLREVSKVLGEGPY